MNPDAAQNVVKSISDSCSRLKDQPYIGVELRKKLNREIDGDCIITGKYIVIYEADESVSVLRVLDTRADYVKVLLAE